MGLVVVCAWCNRIKQENKYIPDHLENHQNNINISHGICKICIAEETNNTNHIYFPV